jgi:hypothetical protein
MATGRLGMQAAALTSVLAVAALLAGPGMTWGLDVPAVGGSGGTTGQLAATAQGVVTTAEQTVGSTVTTVQAAPTTVVQESAPTPVQTPVRTVTAPPARTAPVQKKTPAAATFESPVRRRSEKAAPAGKPAQSTDRTLRQAVGAPALQARPRAVTKAKLPPTASPAARPAAPEPTSQCGGLPALPVLPGGIDLGALVTIACAARNLLTPARIGTGRAADAPVSIGDLLGAALSGGRSAYARAAVLHRHTTAAARELGVASGAGHRGDPVAGAARAGSISASPVGYAGAALAPAQPAGNRHSTATAATRHGHTGVFSTPVDGTGVLSLVLLLDSALLAGIVVNEHGNVR